MIFCICSPIIARRINSERSEHQPNMDKPTRKQLREAIEGKGISAVLQIPRNALTKKQKRFAEAIALEDMTGADAYRTAYNATGKPKTIGDNASRLKNDSRIQAEIEALERAKELAAWHSAESLRALVVSTLTSVATDPTTKAATRVQAAKVIGTIVGVDAFRETKRIEHVKDSGELRQQILDQLKTVMLSGDSQDVDADSLLAEISGSADPTPEAPPQNQDGTPPSHIHTIPHEQSQGETTPLSENATPPGGDIFGENP